MLKISNDITIIEMGIAINYISIINFIKSKHMWGEDSNSRPPIWKNLLSTKED